MGYKGFIRFFILKSDMSKQPNILLSCTDHWPGKMIRALGHPDILTPTLDTAIGNGVAFTNAYTTTPMCVPARRALMTGCFSRTHGDRVQGNLPMPNLPTMAQTFRDSGYQAYPVGKLHEEGRLWADKHERISEDFEMFLRDQGYPGMVASGGTHGTGVGSD